MKRILITGAAEIMKNLKYKTICFFLILISFSVYSQTSNIIKEESETINHNDLCKEIYGKWETYYIELPFGMDPKDRSEIWIFDENGKLTTNNITTSFNLEEDCSKLFIEGVPGFCTIRISKGSLFVTKNILPHESYNFRFKKMN